RTRSSIPRGPGPRRPSAWPTTSRRRPSAIVWPASWRRCSEWRTSGRAATSAPSGRFWWRARPAPTPPACAADCARTSPATSSVTPSPARSPRCVSRRRRRPRSPDARWRWRFRPEPEVLALVGPTAVGKSALAHAAALALGGEVVVADPFQRYRGLEIAADSPRAPELAAVPHHAVGDLDLTEASTAASFAAVAQPAIDGAVAAGRVPIVTGGTGLYLRAAVADLRFPDPAHPLLRNWAERLAREDPQAALAELRARDPERADRIDAANPRRVARALEIAAGGE